MLRTESTIYLLDFEFSQFNYVGFDLGNFLNEWTTEYETFDIKEEREISEALKRRMMQAYYSTLGEKYKVSTS